MGKLRGRYRAEFSEGSKVQIASEATLNQFFTDWKYHHPLQVEQLPFAGEIAIISKVGFYHGGDELYELVGIPGIWHGTCLSLPDTFEEPAN